MRCAWLSVSATPSPWTAPPHFRPQSEIGRRLVLSLSTRHQATTPASTRVPSRMRPLSRNGNLPLCELDHLHLLPLTHKPRGLLFPEWHFGPLVVPRSTRCRLVLVPRPRSPTLGGLDPSSDRRYGIPLRAWSPRGCLSPGTCCLELEVLSFINLRIDLPSDAFVFEVKSSAVALRCTILQSAAVLSFCVYRACGGCTPYSPLGAPRSLPRPPLDPLWTISTRRPRWCCSR